MLLKNKVVIGMSGGIDSSVAAYLLKKEGYEVIGVTLKHLSEKEDDSGKDSKTCCSIDDIMDAKMSCYKLNIPHYVIDAVSDFEKNVIDYFLDEYSNGRTPSPCIVCDEKIKIKKLIEFADKLGAKYISTGHYANVEMNNELSSCLLKNAEDANKDQTYMLYRLSEDTINRMLFPLKNLKKSEVREVAKEFGFKTYSKKDSQGICFAPDGYIEFLSQNLKNISSGNFIDKSGNVMGKHRGYQFYTIGQRRGLGLKLPRAYFVTDIIPERNEIVLGDFEELFTDLVEIEDFKFIPDISDLNELELLAKPRFSSKGNIGKLEYSNSKLTFRYNEKNAENAPGQHIVFYYRNNVVGGGIIKSIKR